MYEDPLTGETKPGVLKVSYTHDAMIDLIIARPKISKTQIAEVFGFTVPWVSQVTNCDAFRARLAERKSELVDPSIVASVDERLRAIADVSLMKLQEKLEDPTKVHSDEFLHKTAELALKASGYGARQQGGGATSVQVGVVVQVPARAGTAKEWVELYAQPPQGS